MNETGAREYSESLGQIFDGGYRQAAWADKQKIPKALGLTMREWVYQYLGGYVRMSVEQRTEAIKELASEGATTSGIARILGADKNTVKAALGQGPPKPSGFGKRADAPPSNWPEGEDAPRSGEAIIDLAAVQKAASKAAQDDPLAALYGIISRAGTLRDYWDDGFLGELDGSDVRRVEQQIEDAIRVLNRVLGLIEQLRSVTV